MTITWRNIIGVKKRALLCIAGCVWCFAGLKVLNLGVPDMWHNWNLPICDLITAAIVFTLFFKFIFSKLIGKHLKRIRAYVHQRVCVFAFFDVKTYCIIAFMMTGGILLRNAHIVNPLYLGTFYTGLGSALLVAGCCFFYQFIVYHKKLQQLEEAAEQQPA